MSALFDLGLDLGRRGYTALAAGYLLLCVLLAVLAFRRGGRGLGITVILCALVSCGLFGGLLALFDRHPAFLRSGADALGPSLAAVLERALSLRLGTRVLVIERPAALFLLALLPWLFPALRMTLTDVSPRQVGLQLGLRMLLAAALIGALAQPSWLDKRVKLSTVALVDVSDSMSATQLERARAAVDELRALSTARGHDLSVVTFGGRPRLQPLAAPGTPQPPFVVAAQPEKPRSDAGTPAMIEDRSATNLQSALQLAYGLHTPDTLRRVLLLSDGNQTEGDALAEAQSAAKRKVRVSYLPLAAEPQPEVLVREVRLASGEEQGAQLKVGAPFLVEAEIYSSVAQKARVTLLQDERENPGDGHRDLELTPGRNILRFRSEASSAGYKSYRVKVERQPGEPPLLDRFADNNVGLLPLSVRGRPKVLYIEGESASRGYLSDALTRENIDVDVRNPFGLPRSAKDLLAYDLVLLSDTSATLLSQAHMQAIESYVRDFGGGFVMAGGENSFGSGGYQGTLLEKVLPVRFEQEKKRDQPSLGLVLCIDRSGSMNGPKLELAKEAARATASMLGADDLIGVVAFDSQAIPVVRLQRAQNRVRISTDISRLTSGGGTQLLPPLQEAYQQLGSAPAKVKHVILLTDGQAEYGGIIDLVDQMVSQRITVSTVGVGTGADQTLLTAIAEHGGGRFYYTQDANSIPKIFTKETTQVARAALVEEKVRPVVAKFVEMLDGVGIESAPALRGYVATKPKPLSEVILVSPQGEPLLVRWRLGLGQAVAFTSDVKNRWAADWLRWPGYAKFWAQLVRSAMRHDSGKLRGQGYELSASASPPWVHVRVDAVSSDDRFVSGLDTTVEVIEPTLGLVTPSAPAGNGRVLLAAPLLQTAPGRYEGDLRLDLTGTAPGKPGALFRSGAYLLRAVHRSPPPSPGVQGPIVSESLGSLSISYPREYLALPPDLALLDRIAEATGGARLSAIEHALDEKDESVRFLRALWQYLAGAAALLLLVDVLLRRVRLFGYRALSL